MVDEAKEQVDWIQHADVQAYLTSSNIQHPWFPAYKQIKAANQMTTWFSALVPIPRMPELIMNDGWDLTLGDGHPSVWTHYNQGQVSRHVYCAFGNEDGIEPLVLYRNFHGMREDYVEVVQEFCLYHNLYPEYPKKRFMIFNEDGNESEAVRYG